MRECGTVGTRGARRSTSNDRNAKKKRERRGLHGEVEVVRTEHHVVFSAVGKAGVTVFGEVRADVLAAELAANFHVWSTGVRNKCDAPPLNVIDEFPINIVISDDTGVLDAFEGRRDYLGQRESDIFQ